MTYDEILKNEENQLEKYGENRRVLSDTTNQQQGRTRRVRFHQMQGLASAEEMEYANPKTFNTPQKCQQRQIQTGELKVGQEVLDRTRNCTGFPVEVFCQEVGGDKKDPRRRCYVCKMKTKWKCVNCRFYFCMTTKKVNNRDALFYFTQEKENIDCSHEVTQVYGKSCYHVAHEGAIQEHFKKARND